MELLHTEAMNETQALEKMVAPGTRRKGKYREGVIQILVTRACNEACFNCTQGSQLRGKPRFISLESFEMACRSLKDYFGVAGIFGGNPALHPRFEQLCEIMQKWIPKERRGIWCNHPIGKGAVMRKTFNPSVSNLNVHLNQEAYDEFKRDWPECGPVGLTQDSRHSPPYVAMQDVISDESKRWELISDCDINKHWSAMLCEFRGSLRGFFCEIAGAQAVMHQDEPDYPDLGINVAENPDWWQWPMQSFAEQVRFHCHGCGVPLRGHGELAQSQDVLSVEQVSKTHVDAYNPKRPNRVVQIVDELEALGTSLPRFTDYLKNSSR